MSPGAYLRAAREAVGLTVLDVALRTETTPPVDASARARLVGAIEDDLVIPCQGDLLALQEVYHFEWRDFEAATGSTVATIAKPILRRAA